MTEILFRKTKHSFKYQGVFHWGSSETHTHTHTNLHSYTLSLSHTHSHTPLALGRSSVTQWDSLHKGSFFPSVCETVKFYSWSYTASAFTNTNRFRTGNAS